MTHILKPTEIEAAGIGRKIIEEFIGKVNSKTDEVSIARMTSPSGWVEPPQTPAFNEYTLVLKGMLCVSAGGEKKEIRANEAFIAASGEEVQYSTPGPDGAEYISVCLPAFSPDTVHRKE